MATNYSPKIPRSDLSFYFDVANPKCYTSGSTIYDLSGNGNNGTIYGAPNFSNRLMEFDGTNDYILIPSNQNSLDFSSEQTIIMWIYHTYTSGRKNPYDQSYGGYGTWTHENGSFIRYYHGDAGSNASPYTAFGSTSYSSTPTNTWTMIGTIRDTVYRSFLKNGSITYTTSNSYGSLTTTTADIRIGRGYAGYWIGSMGPVMGFKRALNNFEISEIYNSMKGRFR